MERDEFETWLRSVESLYRPCTDAECPDRFAYRFDGEQVEHFHYIGPREQGP